MATLPTVTELRGMSPSDIQKDLAEQQLLLAKMRLEVAAGGQKDTAKLRRLRKEIARMNTVLAEKSTSATVPAPAKSPKKS